MSKAEWGLLFHRFLNLFENGFELSGGTDLSDEILIFGTLLDTGRVFND